MNVFMTSDENFYKHNEFSSKDIKETLCHRQTRKTENEKQYFPTENSFQGRVLPYLPMFSTFSDENTGPRSAVGNVSGYRCVSDCRSRGRSSIPARSHTFVEIDHEIISTVILLPSADSFKKGCCQLQAKVCAQITG